MGKITRKEAERQLLARENEAGVFLIRESETCPGKIDQTVFFPWDSGQINYYCVLLIS